MKIHYLTLILAVPIFFTTNASETPTKQLQHNLDEIFKHYTTGTLTPGLCKELQLTELLKEVSWALSRIKTNQDDTH